MIDEEPWRAKCEKNAVPTDVGRSSVVDGTAGGCTSNDQMMGSRAEYVAGVS